jgi:hypothetical protein
MMRSNRAALAAHGLTEVWLEGLHFRRDRALDLIKGHHPGPKFGIPGLNTRNPARCRPSLLATDRAALPSLSMSRLRTFPLLLALLLFSSISSEAFAQPRKVQPGKARVILARERMAEQFDTVDVVKNVFKFNPLLFFRGEIPLYYERALTPNVSLELGLGVTLRNYLALSFTGDDADDYGAGTEIIANPSYHVAARIYFVHDLEPQGFYVQPGFAHLVYSKDILVRAPDGSFTEEKYRDERTFNDLRVLVGFQQLGSSSNWLFDVYGGVAYRDRRMLVVNEQLDLQNDLYTYSVEERKDRVPAIFLGVKIGLGF